MAKTLPQPRLPHKRIKKTSAKMLALRSKLPSKLSKRAVLGQETGHAAQAAAGHLVHLGSVFLGHKNLVRRCRSMNCRQSYRT